MSLGLIGKKVGMTRVFNETGVSEAVSVVWIFPSKVSQIKNEATDGYDAVQIAYYPETKVKANKAMAGICKKTGIPLTKAFKEFLIDDKSTLQSLQVGSDLSIELFKEGQFIDVSGLTKGKGFTGVIKRHNFSSQDATHGNSVTTNAPGSIGQRQSPGKVFKGKKMAGRLGNSQCTIQNLKVLKIDVEKNLILVKGAVPGAKNSHVVLLPAVKEHGATE